MGLLARREHSCLELKQKMKIRGFDDQLIDQQIIEFSERDWQSEKRYGDMLLRSRVLKCHGPLKIKSEMKNKGLSSSIIHGSKFEQIDWTSLATEALNKKYSSKSHSQQEQNKRYRFLQQRGFTTEQIKIAFREARYSSY